MIAPGTRCVKQEEISWKIFHLTSIRVKLLNNLLIYNFGSLSQLFVIAAHVFLS